MSWNNWTPDQYSAQRREQVEEAARLACYLSGGGSADVHETQHSQGSASRLASEAVRGVTEVLVHLRLRHIHP